MMIVPSEKNSPAIQRILALLAKMPDMSASDLSREAFVGIATLAYGCYRKELRTTELCPPHMDRVFR